MGESGADAALRQATQEAGLDCAVEVEQPLDEFLPSKGEDADAVTAFLVRVDSEQETWPSWRSKRRRWCLPEEARGRIRRKPMRRLIDLAVRQLHRPADRPA